MNTFRYIISYIKSTDCMPLHAITFHHINISSRHVALRYNRLMTEGIAMRPVTQALWATRQQRE